MEANLNNNLNFNQELVQSQNNYVSEVENFKNFIKDYEESIKETLFKSLDDVEFMKRDNEKLAKSYKNEMINLLRRIKNIEVSKLKYPNFLKFKQLLIDIREKKIFHINNNLMMYKFRSMQTFEQTDTYILNEMDIICKNFDSVLIYYDKLLNVQKEEKELKEKEQEEQTKLENMVEKEPFNIIINSAEEEKKKEDLEKAESKTVKPKRIIFNKEFLDSKLEENGAITSEKGYLDVMIGGINEKGNEHLCLPNGMGIEEDKLDHKNMRKREKIKAFSRNIERFLNKPEFNFIINKPFKLKINSDNLKFNNLFELLNHIEFLRKKSLSKYHSFIKKINKNIDEKIKADVTLKNEEEKAEMKKKLLEEYNFKHIRIYGIWFKARVNEVLEKEIKFLRKLYQTMIIIEYLEKEEISKNEYQDILEKDLTNIVDFYGKNTISSYEHLLGASSKPLDEEKQMKELALKNFYETKTGNKILIIGDPANL